ncbi:MAG TPA: hypothetical protein VG326_08675 [Tepidisphaeraceae bacterium]|jgi:hypothetical protein|nr:hypothetical protein [Tepidisphaeraceae bacterium]
MRALRLPDIRLSRLRGFIRGLLLPTRRETIAAMAMAAFLWGGGDHRHQAEAASKRPKAWFDAKGAFVFPLGDGPLPSTRDELSDGLSRGWKAQLRFPEGGDLVKSTGGRYPAVGNLHVQLGGGIIDTDRDEKREPPLRPSGNVESRVAVRDFDLDARPLICDKAKLDMHLSATDARFDIERDEHGKPMVMMSDAKRASFSFQAGNEDIERMLVTDLNGAVERYHVTFQSAKLKLEAVNNRSIDIDLKLTAKVAFVPAGMHFQAHVEIDDEMYAKLSSLKCEGDEALGPLIVGLIRPGLRKYEGKSRLVFSFPTGQLKLRDVKIQGGDEIKIGASFAR